MTQLNHFEIPAYFIRFADSLTIASPHAVHTAVVNGKKDSVSGSVYDWHKLLKPFADIDLNLKALQNRYQVDTLYLSHGIQVTYLPDDSRLKIQKVVIRFDQFHTLVSFVANQHEDNMVYQSTQELEFRYDEGFTVQGSQQLNTGGKTSYLIALRFTR